MIVLNLLPPEEKKNILSDRLNRKITFLGINFIFLLMILIFLLTAIFFAANIKLKTTQNNLKIAQNNLKIEKFQNLQLTIKKINDEIDSLDKIQTNYRYYSEFLKNITAIMPLDIFIKKISIDNQNKVILEGFSQNRDSILSLQGNLNKTNNFEKIDNPLTNLIKPINIDFQLSFSIKESAFQHK